MYIQNRKLIIASLFIANFGLITLPWYFAAIAALLAIINLIKNHDYLFSFLILMTAFISATIGSLMPAIVIELPRLSLATINLENLKMVMLIMLVPLGINLLFISSFDSTPMIGKDSY